MSQPPLVRRTIGILFALAVLPVALLAGSFAWFRYSNAAVVQRLERAVRARGEPITLREVAATYPPLPENENAAPLLIQIWRKDNPEVWDAFLRGDQKLPNRRPPKVDPHLPWLGKEAQKIPRTQPLSVPSRAALDRYLMETAERRAAVRIALQRPGFRFPMVIEDGIAAQLPHYSEMRQDMQLCQLESLQKLEEGDLDGSLESLVLIRSLADRLKKDPFLLGQLVRMSGYGMLLGAVELTLSRSALNPAQRQAFRELVSGIDLEGAFTRSLIAERATMLSPYHDPGRFYSNVLRFEAGEPAGAFDERGIKFMARIYGFLGVQDRDQRLILETMEEALELAEDPAAIPARKLKLLGERAGTEAGRSLPRIIVGLMLMPAVANAGDKFATVIARRNAVLAALAIEDYRATHGGNLPPDLADVASRLTVEQLMDPFSGDSLKFKRQDKGYVVYSIGPDRKDNDGRERPERGPLGEYDLTVVVERN